MTDNENINAYEGLTSRQQLNLFRNLYYNDGFSTERGIVANAINDILTKYHKQQSEIERLKDGCSSCCVLRAKSETISELNEQIEYWQRGYNDLLQENKKAKSAAIKEFAERLKENITDCHTVSDGEYVGYDWTDITHCIDKLLKEIVGE